MICIPTWLVITGGVALTAWIGLAAVIAVTTFREWREYRNGRS
jgi:hypothetical protein